MKVDEKLVCQTLVFLADIKDTLMYHYFTSNELYKDELLERLQNIKDRLQEVVDEYTEDDDNGC